MAISNSQLTLYKKCPQRYKFRYIDKIETPTPEAFRFGTKFHEAIEMGRSNNPDIQKMIDKLYAHKEYLKFLIVDNQKVEFEKKEKIVLNGIEFVYITDGRTDTDIIEFKSAANEWDDNKFLTEWQPHVYMKLEQLRTGVLKKFNYFIVGKGKVPFIQHKIVPFNQKIWKNIEETCNELMNDFEFKPTAYKREKGACFWCEYKNNCSVLF